MRISWLAVAAATFAFCGSAHATEFVTNGDFTQLSNGVGQLNSSSYTGGTTATGWSTGPNGYNFVMTVGDVGSNGQYGNVSLWDANNIDAGHTNTWNGTTLSGAGNFVAMDGDFQTSAVSQTITGLTVGKTYTLSFNYAFGQQYGFNQSVTEDLTASLGGFSVTLPSAFSGCDGSGNNCTGGYLNPEHGFSGWSTFTTTITATSTSELLSFLAGGSKQVPPFALISDVSLTANAPGPGPATGPLAVLGLLALGYARLRRGQA
jgi:hypothetical protein